MYTIGLWVADPPSEIHDHIPSAAYLKSLRQKRKTLESVGSGLIPVDFDIETIG